MYRIEVKPGEEAVFRTIEELATGIRNGFITPRARIYHAASQKWLPIEFHPHYKKALEGNYTPTPAAPQPSLAAMPAPTFAFPSAAPAPAPSSTPPTPSTVPAAVTTAPNAVRPPSPASTKATTSSTSAAESPVLAMRAAVRHTHADVDEMESEGPVERYSPVPAAGTQRSAAVLEAPAPAAVLETHRPKAGLDAVRPAPAPEVVLPNITYPEVPSMESEHRAPARRSRRAAGRPLLLIGSAAALVLGGQRFLAGRGAGENSTAEVSTSDAVPAKAPPLERKGAVTQKAQPATQPGGVAAPRTPAQQLPAPAPATAQRMQPGPAFAASVPASGPVIMPGQSTTPRTAPPSPTPIVGQTSPADAAIAPAPSAVDLDVPAVVPESIAPVMEDNRDSLAIKRILKAVTGRKANPTAP